MGLCEINEMRNSHFVRIRHTLFLELLTVKKPISGFMVYVVSEI